MKFVTKQKKTYLRTIIGIDKNHRKKYKWLVHIASHAPTKKLSPNIPMAKQNTFNYYYFYYRDNPITLTTLKTKLIARHIKLDTYVPPSPSRTNSPPSEVHDSRRFSPVTRYSGGSTHQLLPGLRYVTPGRPQAPLFKFSNGLRATLTHLSGGTVDAISGQLQNVLLITVGGKQFEHLL